MELALLCANRFWSHTCSEKTRSLGHGPWQKKSKTVYELLTWRSGCDYRKPMPGALVKLRPGHQRQDLLTTESFTAACRCLAYGARQRLFRRKLSTEHYDGTGSE